MTLALNQVAKIISRALFAMLLMLAAFTPALAEVGCLEDALVHDEEQSASQRAAVAASDGSSEDRNQERPVGQAVHCAFSHCMHAYPSVPPLKGAIDLDLQKLTYAPAPAHRLAPSPRDGPDRPPRI